MSTQNERAANPIEALAARIQILPPELRWFHAQEDVIIATALGFPPSRGPWTVCADRLIAIGSWIGAERVVTVLASLFLLAGFYLAQFRVAAASENDIRPLFIGIGVLREPELVKQFELLFGGPARRLSTFDLNTFRFRRLGLRVLWREWTRLWRGIWSNLDRTSASNLIRRSYCLTCLMLQCHRYAYFRAWFRSYLESGGENTAIGFTVANESAFAAIDAGVRAIQMQHGFQGYGLVYPDFAQVFCSNRFDSEHLVKRLPRVRAQVVPERFAPLDTRRGVAIAGGYWEPDNFDLCRPFIEWTISAGVPVYVRRHPRDTSRYWDGWRGTKGIEIVDRDCAFEEFLEVFRPRMLATWYSTTVLDALAKGVLPITFVAPDHFWALNTVFPVRDMAMRWPEQQLLVQAIMEDRDACSAVARERYRNAVGEWDGTRAPGTGTRLYEDVLRQTAS